MYVLKFSNLEKFNKIESLVKAYKNAFKNIL